MCGRLVHGAPARIGRRVAGRAAPRQCFALGKSSTRIVVGAPGAAGGAADGRREEGDDGEPGAGEEPGGGATGGGAPVVGPTATIAPGEDGATYSLIERPLAATHPHALVAARRSCTKNPATRPNSNPSVSQTTRRGGLRGFASGTGSRARSSSVGTTIGEIVGGGGGSRDRSSAALGRLAMTPGDHT
jgi:hypothetical protein